MKSQSQFLLFVLLSSAVVMAGLIIVNRPINKSPTQTNHPAPTVTKQTFTPWTEAVKKINNCEVTSSMQGHNLTVSLRLKNGTTILTKEPNIDAVDKFLNAVQSKCPATMGTE